MTDKSEMIFGVRAVIEAIQAGKEIDKILVKKDIQSDLSKELFAALKGLLIPVQRVPVERINRITRKNHQGVVAFISSVTYQKTEDLVPFLFEQGKNPFFVMLDGITDVRNFGAIARYLRMCRGGCGDYSCAWQRIGECRCHEDFRRCVAYIACLPRTESACDFAVSQGQRFPYRCRYRERRL